MDIISTRELLLDAKKKSYAIPAFNIHNLETLKGVLEAANELFSPVIIATTPGTIKYAGMDFIVAMAKAGAKNYKIPIALHLDHCTNVELLKICIESGYKSVMIDASLKEYSENIRITQEVVQFSNRYRVSVEAELGLVGGEEDERYIDDKDLSLTNPSIAVDFVEKTDIDSLAVAIGTQHGVYKSEPKLDFDRLAKINSIVSVPLVLHGASGVPNESITKAIENGICKINIATELKIPFANAIRDYLNENPSASDPRHYLKPGIEAIKKVAMEKIILCGSNNRI